MNSEMKTVPRRVPSQGASGESSGVDNAISIERVRCGTSVSETFWCPFPTINRSRAGPGRSTNLQ